ncbi:site-specific integrase [Otariodibacter sp.]|uniref:site-specific integrase n=1 Tax=Otariodibacter sp. TaxID=3030919 RepID=UPI0026164939|nr:site-specific integrase [Otariodibacter sp.]
MATFIKSKNGWRVQIRKKGIYKSCSFRTKAEAQNWAIQIESEINAGQYSDIPHITFAELVDKYIKEYTVHKKGKRPETLRLTRLCKMPIGKIYIKDLTEEDFINWRDQRLEKVSVATLLREWNTLAHLMRVAVEEWRYLKINHLKGVRRPKPPKERTRRYSDDEIEKLVFVSRFSFDYPSTTVESRTGAAMLFAIETAMRAGEICNAKWENLTYLPNGRAILHIPMSKNGYPRDIPLSMDALKIVEHLKPLKDETDLIFQLKSASLDATFRKLKKLADLDNADLHFHDTRREALSRLSKKVDVMTLAKISGHREIKILLNTYYAPDMKEVVNLI